MNIVRSSILVTAVLLVSTIAALVAVDTWSRRVLAEHGARAATHDIETLLPALDPAAPNAAEALDRLADLLPTPTGEQASDLDPLDVGRLRDWTVADTEAIARVLDLAEHQRALEIVDRDADVASARPPASGDELRDLYRAGDRVHRRSAVRTASQLLAGRAFLALVDGRPDDAYRDVLAMLRLARWVADEGPEATGAIVSTMLQSLALSTLEDVAAYAPPPEDLLPRLRSDLEAFAARSPRRWIDGVLALGLAETEGLDRPFARGVWTWEERLDVAREIEQLLALATWADLPAAERGDRIAWPEHILPWRRAEAVLIPNLEAAVHRRAAVIRHTELGLGALDWEEVLRAELRLPTVADLASLPAGVVALVAEDDGPGEEAGEGEVDGEVEEDDEPPACFLALSGAEPPTADRIWRLPCARETLPPAEPVAPPATGTRRAAIRR